MKKILLVIDSFKREFTGVIFLKAELEKLNFQVHLASRFSLELTYNRVLPEIVILPKTHKITSLKEMYKNSYIIQLGAESFSGGRDALISCSESKAAGGWQDKYVDLTLCWGDFNKRTYEEIGSFPNSVIKTTGHPITETWYQKKKPKSLKNNKKIIGISLSLRTITHKLAPNILQTVVDTELDGFLYDKGFHAESWLLYEITWLRVVTNIIQRFSDQYEIQLRPHPLENHDHYNYFVEKFENVSIHPSEDIITWCDGIDVLLSYMSTSQVDAYVRDVKVISIRDLFPDFVIDGIPKMMMLEMNDFFPNCENLDNLASMIESNESFSNPDLDHFLKDVFNYRDSKKPSENIAHEVELFSKSKNYKKKSDIKKIAVPGKAKFLPRKLYPDYIYLFLKFLLSKVGMSSDPNFSYCPHSFIKNNKAIKKVQSMEF